MYNKYSFVYLISDFALPLAFSIMMLMSPQAGVFAHCFIRLHVLSFQSLLFFFGAQDLCHDHSTALQFVVLRSMIDITVFGVKLCLHKNVYSASLIASLQDTHSGFSITPNLWR